MPGMGAIRPWVCVVVILAIMVGVAVGAALKKRS
jgi:hypothetical protein